MPSTGSFLSPAAAVCAPAPSPFPAPAGVACPPLFPPLVAACALLFPARFPAGGEGGCRCPRRLASVKGRRFAPCERRGKSRHCSDREKRGEHTAHMLPCFPHKKTGRGAQRPSRPRISPTGAVCAPVPSPSFLSAHSHCEGKKECGSSAPPTSPQSQHSHCEGRKRSVWGAVQGISGLPIWLPLPCLEPPSFGSWRRRGKLALFASPVCLPFFPSSPLQEGDG